MANQRLRDHQKSRATPDTGSTLAVHRLAPGHARPAGLVSRLPHGHSTLSSSSSPAAAGPAQACLQQPQKPEHAGVLLQW